MHTYISSRKEIEHKSDDWFILLVILQLYYLANVDNLERNWSSSLMYVVQSMMYISIHWLVTLPLYAWTYVLDTGIILNARRALPFHYFLYFRCDYSEINNKKCNTHFLYVLLYLFIFQFYATCIMYKKEWLNVTTFGM